MLFSLDDHKYVLHFKKKTKNPILLKSIEDILEQAFMSFLPWVETLGLLCFSKTSFYPIQEFFKGSVRKFLYA